MADAYGYPAADGLFDLILSWQAQVEREAEERARRMGVSELEVTAYAEGCRRGASEMTAILRFQGLLRVPGCREVCNNMMRTGGK